MTNEICVQCEGTGSLRLDPPKVCDVCSGLGYLKTEPRLEPFGEVEENVEHIVTIEDLKENPELVEAGVNIGDTVNFEEVDEESIEEQVKKNEE